MVNEIISNSQIQMVLDHGLDIEGNPIFKNKNFNNVKTTATPDGLYAVATALVPLQQHVLSTLERSNTYTIVETTTTV
jgi:hypothetical protein